MCYRYTLRNKASLGAYEKDLVPADDWEPRYNAALTSRMPVVVWDDQPVVRHLAFGFSLPPRTPGERPLLLANTRADTLLVKPAFRAAVRSRRCLIPADGFFEWENQGPGRLPHYFYLSEQQPFFLAGLWQPANEHSAAGFSIVTTTANALLQSIHDRMPVILGPNSGPVWLGDQPIGPDLLTRLCRPLPAEKMRSHRVDPRMNHARYQAADSIEPV